MTGFELKTQLPQKRNRKNKYISKFEKCELFEQTRK
jgi:hypothetical protein